MQTSYWLYLRCTYGLHPHILTQTLHIIAGRRQPADMSLSTTLTNSGVANKYGIYVMISVIIFIVIWFAAVVREVERVAW